jgi:hypothetical protein
LRSFRSMNLIQKGNSHFWIRLVSDAVESGSSATIAFVICSPVPSSTFLRSRLIQMSIYHWTQNMLFFRLCADLLSIF